ncbi:alpha/beta hydrolase [Evansella sp. AB-rgal1]|uniref:alpha/beta hydrolase n=1 Tax=Evansella sp. AB-rgal1 TaxID=3242696 RepID=UPI00359CCEC8
MIYEVKKLYEDREDVTLTSYVHSDSSELLNGEKRGAVLICPGGAYVNCSDREAEPVAFRFASMGYHAFVLRYSTYMNGEKGFPEMGMELSINEKSLYPNPMRDIGKAMLYIRERAEEWFIDTEKIAICGFSAGAHNCAMYSVYWNDPVLTEYFDVTPVQLKPAATILGYMLSDFTLQNSWVQQSDDPGTKHIADVANIAYTGTIDPDQELLHKISPARHVSDVTPPTFLWTTTEDALVPVEHTIRMAGALAQNNIPFEMHVFEEGQHGLSLANQATASNRELLNLDAAKWIDLCEQWLLKRFQLDLPEK